MSKEVFVSRESLPEAYHRALTALKFDGSLVPCPDWGADMTQLEIGLTMEVRNPLKEPRISRLFPGGPHELEQYVMEIVYGILNFEVDKGNWAYTYNDRMVNYARDYHPMNQIKFVIQELQRNPYSRRAVIDIRDNIHDMYSNEPACLQHIQYLIRDDKLDCKVLFRSNDACKATFMNAFALIKLQESIAYELDVGVGTYTHRANSFHCYSKDYQLLDGYANRILFGGDTTYNYEDDWKESMTDAIPNILTTVDTLKQR